MKYCEFNIQKLLFFVSLAMVSLLVLNINTTKCELAALDLTINKERFLPQETLEVMVQPSGMEVIGDIELAIADANKNTILKKFLPPENKTQYKFEHDAVPGDCIITASYENISAKRVITILEKKEISSEIVESKLTIKNTGNVLYINTIKIAFVNENGESRIKIINLDLSVNQQAEFELAAKDGVYDIIVNDKLFDSVPLTGKVTAVIKLQGKKGILSQSVMLTFFIFVVLLVFIVLLAYNLKEKPFKVRSRRSSNYDYIEVNREEKIKTEESKPLAPSANLNLPPKKSIPMNLPPKEPIPVAPTAKRTEFSVYPQKQVEHSLMLNGDKQGTTIVVVNAKNLSELKNKLEGGAYNALTNFIDKQVTAEIEQNKGFAKRITDHSLMGIFSPSTKQFRHEFAGIKAALNIRNALENYNHKLKDKLEYGIGINTGELIVSMNRMMQYTSMGNTITLAKKVSETSKNDVRATNNTYSRVSKEVQGSSAGKISTIDGDIEIYSLKGIGTRETYKSYLNDVLKRIK